MRSFIKCQWIFLLFATFSLLTAGCEEEKANIESGMQALESRNYDKAIEVFKSCIDNEGERGKLASVCSFFLGKTYYEKGQYKEAIKFFEKGKEMVLKRHQEGKKMELIEFMHAVKGAMDYWPGLAWLITKMDNISLR